MCLFLVYRRSAALLCQWIIIKDKTLTSILFFYSFLGSYYDPLKFCESEEKKSATGLTICCIMKETCE